MIESKKINIIIAVAVVFALVMSALFVVLGKTQGNTDLVSETEAEYASKIFGSDIISIEILADEEDWQQMLDNAISEQFIMADVIVNGTKFESVGIRPKGNSSLTQVASSDSDRYSFRLQFDEYIKGQTCFGLESFVLNNMIGDYTYMKEYISYDMMREVGVDTPYFGFADIKVNGEGWGLYLAVELYNSSYEQRVFNDTSGMLYNVKSMDMGGDWKNNAHQNLPQGFPQGNPPDISAGISQSSQQDTQKNNQQSNQQNKQSGNTFPAPNGNAWPATMQNGDFSISPDKMFENIEDFAEKGDFGGFGGFGGSSGGGSLEYTDDDIDSYSSIFSNVVGKGTDSDYKRVIKALKKLSEGEDLEEYFDVDKILRYLAAHTFVVNLDSYSSGMAQNYYLYENDGKITILPWDYNLAWGGFQSGSVSSVINFPIDTPVSGVTMERRPLIDKLLSNTEYLEKYHSYLQQLVDNYFANGKFEEKIKTLDALISEYVKNDPTAFCTYEEYEKAVSAILTLGNLRAESVQGQLDGTVPSTTEAQNENPDLLISAGNLNLSDLGSFMGGGGDFGGGRGMMGNKGGFGGFPRELPGERNNSLSEGIGEFSETPDTQASATLAGRFPQKQGNNFPGNSFSGNTFPGNQSITSYLIMEGALILILIVAILFAAKYKKKY